MEHRDSPGIDPETEDETPSRTGRFARLVESPAARRVALSRLVPVAGLSLAVVVLVAMGAWKLVRSAGEWVNRRPELQIPFAKIELDPSPDPWIRGGAALILEEARSGRNPGETISLLELDLKELETDFRRCPWVKDVIQVDRSHHGRLIVRLAYRKPMAVVEFPKFKPGAFAIDEDGVVLPECDLDLTSRKRPYQVRGMDGPLIAIWGLPADSPPPRYGVPWKRKVEGNAPDDADPMVLRAARIARFLRDRKASSKTPNEAPDFASIYLPSDPDKPFFLIDADKNLVSWGKAPGDEKPGEPDSDARWKMLLDWVKNRGPLSAKHPDYLYFDGNGARLHQGKP